MPLLKKLNCTRDKKQQINAETYTIGNTQREICCYDKIAELLNSNKTLPYGFTDKSNIFRCESRLLHTDTVQRASKKNIITCKDLINNYDLLSSLYESHLKNKLLRQDIDLSKSYSLDTTGILKSVCSQSLNIKQQVKLFVDICIGQATRDCLESINVDDCINIYKDCLDKTKISKENYRQTVSRFRKELENYIFYWFSIMKNDYEIPLADLYQELYTKLLKNIA